MLQYDPQTKTLTVAHQDFRIDAVYVDDGVYCLVPKDPNELLFITNGKRIIRAHNFEYGRGLFIRYIRTGAGHPRIFTLKTTDTISVEEGTALYLLITSACTDGITEWLQEKDALNKPHTIQEMLDNIATEYRGDMVVAYFTQKDNFAALTPYTGIIPNMEPQVAVSEDFI